MHPTTVKPSELRLLSDSHHSVNISHTTHREVIVPEGVSAFAKIAGGVTLLSCNEPDDNANTVSFETIRIEGRAALLMIASPGADVRVNGFAPPAVSLLEIRDQLQVDAELFHVSRFRDVRPGAPPKEVIGRICGVCRLKIVPESAVIVHDCGAPLHAEDESVPEGKRLRCASFGSCPTCELPVELEAGYAYLPDSLA